MFMSRIPYCDCFHFDEMGAMPVRACVCVCVCGGGMFHGNPLPIISSGVFFSMRLEGRAPDWLKPGRRLFKRILVDHTGKEIVHHFAKKHTKIKKCLKRGVVMLKRGGAGLEETGRGERSLLTTRNQIGAKNCSA